MMRTPWRMQYDAADAAPGADLLFGTYETQLWFTKMPVLDAAEGTYSDRPTPRGDGGRVGKDTKGTRVVTFEIEMSTRNEDEGRALLDLAGAAWDAEAVRGVNGAVASLTSHTGRTAFGRPRKWTVNDERLHLGRATIGAEFLTLDDLWYGAEQVETVRLAPNLVGGLVAPLTAPLLTTADSNRQQPFLVGGRKPSYPVITIRGPIINPVLELVGVWRYGFTGVTLAYDETITLDLRPFARTILRNRRTTVPLDAQSSPVLDAAMPPGTRELVLRGVAPSGTPYARLSWRDTSTHW